MSEIFYYEFDEKFQTLIRYRAGASDIQQISRGNLVWHHADDPYLRALWLGQGCWERLETIREDEAQRILSKWGYSLSNE